MTAAVLLIVGGLSIPVYAYVLYPLVLRLLARTVPSPCAPTEWPAITIILPVHNEEAVIEGTLQAVLASDYPPERRRILVISDASNDRTDEIVKSVADRGVELARLPVRGGKTAAENAAAAIVETEIVVNTDASVRLHPGGLKALVTALWDPTVGVASGRDVSVGSKTASPNVAESGYVGYEMWVRDLETRAGGIVGASGCFFASRRGVQGEIVPAALSRDFAAPLIAREHGLRSVSVPGAICFVPQASSIRREYRRKVRTMSRGLQTLFYKRRLLNPSRYGRFAWMLASHKLARWLVPWAILVCGAGSLLLAWAVPTLRPPVGLVWGFVMTCSTISWLMPEARLPRIVAIPAYVTWGLVAGVHAWISSLRGDLTPTWEPTKRAALEGPIAERGPSRTASLGGLRKAPE